MKHHLHYFRENFINFTIFSWQQQILFRWTLTWYSSANSSLSFMVAFLNMSTFLSLCCAINFLTGNHLQDISQTLSVIYIVLFQTLPDPCFRNVCWWPHSPFLWILADFFLSKCNPYFMMKFLDFTSFFVNSFDGSPNPASTLPWEIKKKIKLFAIFHYKKVRQLLKSKKHNNPLE